MFSDNPSAFAAVTGVSAALIFAVLVLPVCKLCVNLRRRNKELSERAGRFELKDIRPDSLCGGDFEYKNTDKIFIFRKPYKKEDPVWDVFLKYVSFLPKNKKISGMALIAACKRGDASSSDYFEDDFGMEKSSFLKLNPDFYIYGYYLIPLSESQKIELISQLGINIKNLPRSYLSRGRDFIYAFCDNSDYYMSLGEYRALIDSVYNGTAAAECGLSKSDIRSVTSFLASLQRYFVCANKPLSPEYLFDGEILDFFTDSFIIKSEKLQRAIFEILVKIWKGYYGDLFSVADRKLNLLSAENRDAASLNINVFRLAADRFLKYISDECKRKNDFYSSAAYEVNLTFSKIAVWYSINNPDYLAKELTERFAEIIKNILKFNSYAGQFNENLTILELVDELFAETRNSPEESAFNELYLSEEVKTAYMRNALRFSKKSGQRNKAKAYKSVIDAYKQASRIFFGIRFNENRAAFFRRYFFTVKETSPILFRSIFSIALLKYIKLTHDIRTRVYTVFKINKIFCGILQTGVFFFDKKFSMLYHLSMNRRCAALLNFRLIFSPVTGKASRCVKYRKQGGIACNSAFFINA